jgi:hypothetical protein
MVREGRREYAGVAAWPTHRATASEIAAWRREPDYGIAINARAVRAIDVDVDDAELAEQVEAVITEILGHQLLARRRPGSPRFLVGLRVDAPVRKRVIDAGCGRIELLGDGQQFVACGTHKSGVRYSWAGGALPDFEHAEIAVLDRLWAVLKERFEWAPDEAPPVQGRGDVEADPLAELVSEEVIVDLRSALKAIDATPYDMWIRIGLALRGLGDRGRELWEDWSETAPNYDSAAIDEKWAGFRPERTGYRAVFAEAQRRGWVNPRAGSPQSAGASSARPSTIKPSGSGFAFRSVAELLADRTVHRDLIDGILPEGGLGLIFGEPASGKSLIAMDWAACVATGTEWCGRRVEQGAVFVIAGEGHAGLGRRFAAWALSNLVDLAQAPLFVSAGPAALVDPTSAEAVGASIEALASEHGAPRLVVVDTLHRNFGPADENSAADFARFLASLDGFRERFGCAVLVVHHSGHMDPGRSRGSSAIRAALDVEYRLEATDGRRTLTSTKSKDDRPPEPMAFELREVVLTDRPADEDGELQTSVVLAPVHGAVARRPRLGKWEQHAMRAIAALADPDPARELAVDDVITRAVDAEPFDAGSGKDDRRREQARRALGGLAQKGLITLVGNRITNGGKIPDSLDVGGEGGA